MAKRGRKRTPLNVLQIRGSTRVYDRPKNEPEPVKGMPNPPEWLKNEGLAEWNRISPLLFKQGTLGLVDGVLLAAYCRTYELYVNIEKQLKVRNQTIKRANGSKMKNPVITIFFQTQDRLIKLANELGIGASSRANISLPEEPKEENKAQQWIDKQKGA